MHSKYDRDPEALAWAREKVEGLVCKMKKFEQQALENGTTDPKQWRRIANILQMELIGGDGCVVARFDHRLPEFCALLDKSEA